MTDNEGADRGGDASSTPEGLQRQEPNDPANDPLFVREGDEDGSSSRIWADRDLLSIGTVPGPDRIVGRDTEIKSVAGEIRHLIHGSQPNHVVIYGETGTGKSLVSRHVSDRLVDTAMPVMSPLQVSTSSVRRITLKRASLEQSLVP